MEEDNATQCNQSSEQKTVKDKTTVMASSLLRASPVGFSAPRFKMGFRKPSSQTIGVNDLSKVTMLWLGSISNPHPPLIQWQRSLPIHHCALNVDIVAF